MEEFEDPELIWDAVDAALEYEPQIRSFGETLVRAAQALMGHADPLPLPLFVPMDDQGAITAVLAQHAHRKRGAVAAMVSAQESNAAILLSAIPTEG